MSGEHEVPQGDWPPVPTARLGRFADLLGGARLCYGEPVRAGDRVVIPVARVRGAGGGGFGRKGGTDEEDGGGGGGVLEASPAGYLEITPEGTRYEPIPDPVYTARAVGAGASGLAMLVSTALGVRRMLRRRRALLPPD